MIVPALLALIATASSSAADVGSKDYELICDVEVSETEDGETFVPAGSETWKIRFDPPPGYFDPVSQGKTAELIRESKATKRSIERIDLELLRWRASGDSKNRKGLGLHWSASGSAVSGIGRLWVSERERELDQQFNLSADALPRTSCASTIDPKTGAIPCEVNVGRTFEGICDLFDRRAS